MVGIINRTSGVQNGSMELTKRVRNAQGELQRPADSQSYVMQVSSDSFNRFVTLDKDNDFTAVSYTHLKDKNQQSNIVYGNYSYLSTACTVPILSFLAFPILHEIW